MQLGNYFHHFFSVDYLFSPVLPQYWGEDKNFLIAGIIIFAIGLALWFYKKATTDKLHKMLLRRWYNLFLTIGIFTLLWSALRYELIQYITVRAVVWAIFIWGVVWAIKNIIYMRTGYIKEQQQRQQSELKNKYL